MGGHPYRHGRVPYIALREQPDFELFRPGCGIRDLMGLQAARNRDRSQRAAHRDMSIAPVVLQEKGADLPKDAFTTRGARVITVGRGVVAEGRVRDYPPHPLPADIAQFDEVNRRDMEDVAGIHRSTMGRPEGKSQSGRHAMLMTQGDVRTNIVSRMLIELSLAKAGQQALWLAWQHVDSKRILPIVGANQEPKIRYFTGKDLFKRGQPFGPYEFNVQARIGIESDMEAVLARIDSLTERGWLRPDNPEDRQLVFSWIGDEYAGVRDPEEEHRSNARAENDQLLDGEVVLTSPGDHHLVHIREHMEFRTSSVYKQKLPNDPGSEGLSGRFDAHIRAHWAEMARARYEPALIAMETQLRVMQEHPEAARVIAQQQANVPPAGGGGNNRQAPQQPQRAGVRG
jgi:hypothetical protein